MQAPYGGMGEGRDSRAHCRQEPSKRGRPNEKEMVPLVDPRQNENSRPAEGGCSKPEVGLLPFRRLEQRNV